jgi:hypothetical protein
MERWTELEKALAISSLSHVTADSSLWEVKHLYANLTETGMILHRCVMVVSVISLKTLSRINSVE